MPGLRCDVVIAIDFDKTVVKQDRPYSDTTTPLRFEPGARDALYALKEAGHVLILYSARANLSLRVDPMLDPLARSGVRRVNWAQWQKDQPINVARYEQMLAFVKRELPGAFDAIDDGTCGKVAADIYIDDRAQRYGQRTFSSLDWPCIKSMYANGVTSMPAFSAFKQEQR